MFQCLSVLWAVHFQICQSADCVIFMACRSSVALGKGLLQLVRVHPQWGVWHAHFHVSPPRLCQLGGSYHLRLILLTVLTLFHPLVELVHSVILNSLFECFLAEVGVLLTLKVTVKIDAMGFTFVLCKQACQLKLVVVFVNANVSHHAQALTPLP